MNAFHISVCSKTKVCHHNVGGIVVLCRAVDGLITCCKHAMLAAFSCKIPCLEWDADVLAGLSANVVYWCPAMMKHHIFAAITCGDVQSGYWKYASLASINGPGGHVIVSCENKARGLLRNWTERTPSYSTDAFFFSYNASTWLHGC